MFFNLTELFHKFTLLLVELLWDLDIDGHDLWTALIRAKPWRAVAGQLKVRAGLSTSWNLHRNLTVNRFDIYFCTKHSINHRNGGLG